MTIKHIDSIVEIPPHSYVKKSKGESVLKTKQNNLLRSSCIFIMLLAILIINCHIIAFTATAEANSDSITPISSNVVPDGIYALKNASSQKWMDIQYNSTLPGHHVQQYNFSTNPAEGDDIYGLFRITQIENTGRYVIRALLNESLSFGYEGTDVLTKTIPTLDNEVETEDTFTIEKTGSGYLIKPYNSARSYVCCNDPAASGSAGAPGSYLIANGVHDAGMKAVWFLYPQELQVKTGVYWMSNDSGLASGANPRVMDAEGPSYAEGTIIQQWKNGNPEYNNMYYAQVWIVRHIGCGYYTISSSKKFDMYMSYNSTTVTLKESKDSAVGDDSAIQWKIEGNTQDGYSITSKSNSQKAITVPSGTSDGANLIYSSPTASNSGRNRWDFHRIDDVYIASIYSIADTTGASSGGTIIGTGGSAFGDLGHSWIKIENMATDSVVIGAATVGPNEYITVGKWGNQPPNNQMWYNLERHFAPRMNTDNYGGYISVLIRNDKLQSVSNYINAHQEDKWEVNSNCSHLANSIWGTITGSQLDNLLGMPYNLWQSIDSNPCGVDGTFMHEGEWCGYYKDNTLWKHPDDNITINDIPHDHHNTDMYPTPEISLSTNTLTETEFLEKPSQSLPIETESQTEVPVPIINEQENTND